MNFIRSLIEARVGFRLLVATDVLLLGVVTMLGLSRLKEPPRQVPPPKPRIRVEAKVMRPEDVQVFITGYGEAQALKQVRLSPEVAGRVLKVRADLVAGRFVQADEILFEIDRRDYLAAYKDARATLSRIANTIERMRREQQIAEGRLENMERNRDLALSEFERLKKLYHESQIGTQSQVDAAERSYISAVDQLSQMSQAVQTYPMQIREVGYQLESAKAAVFRAATNLKRCSVRAPFSGRLGDIAVEQGQYVAPGQALVQLVDDTVLEIRVPLDGADARQWLDFGGKRGSVGRSWFSDPRQAPVSVRWTEDTVDHRWSGALHRIVSYNKQTRTLTVAVRIAGRTTNSGKSTLPLVEGMFCAVTIPGKIMRQVYRLPRWAVSANDTVYAEVGGRLKTLPVVVARAQNDEAFIGGGLKSGDNVITTRLVNPLENSLLEILKQE